MNSRAGWGRRTWLAAAAVLVVAVVVAVVPVTGPIAWQADGLYYYAHLQQLHGVSHAETIQAIVDAHWGGKLASPPWVWYSDQFFSRRWLLSILSYPLYGLGPRALVVVSAASSVFVAIMLFVMLRRWIADVPAACLAVLGILIDPLHTWEYTPMTDTLALAIQIPALLAAAAYMDDARRRWAAIWIIGIALLSITRDTNIALIIAVLCAGAVARCRRALVLALAGATASLPAFVFFPGLPLTAAAAFQEAGFDIPRHSDLASVLAGYPALAGSVIQEKLGYAAAHPLMAAAFVIGLFCLYRYREAGDNLSRLLAAVPAGYLCLLAISPSASLFRYETMLVPSVLAGLAIGARRLQAPRSPRQADATPR